MYRHVVMFRWAEDADEGAVADALAGLGELPGQVPEVRSFAVGRNAGAGDNHDVVVVVDFDDADAYRRYAEHPAHVELVTQRLRPITAARAAVQHHHEGETG